MGKNHYTGAELERLLEGLPQEVAEAIKAALGEPQNEQALELNVEIGDAPRYLVKQGSEVVFDSAEMPPKPLAWWERLAAQAGLDALAGRIDEAIRRARTSLFAKILARGLDLVTLFSVAGLAATAGWLVARDRWQENAIDAPLHRLLWERWDFSVNLMLPPYFSAIFVIAGLLLVLSLARWRLHTKILAGLLGDYPEEPKPNDEDAVGFTKNQKRIGLFLLIISALIVMQAILFIRYLFVLPNLFYAAAILGICAGWILVEIPLGRVSEKLKRNGGRWAAMLLAHAALANLLGRIYTQEGIPWFSILFLLLAGANLFTYRREVGAGFWLSSLAMVVYTINVDGWWYAVIGDEYAFYRDAVSLSEKGLRSLLEESVFLGDFTYGSHPYFSSLLQAPFIRFFGDNNFGWRFSSIYYAAVSAGVFYAFLKNIFRKNLALMAAVLLSGSHYLMSFSKIGYNNPQALFTLSITLWAASYAVKSKQYAAFFLLGIVTGINLYVYPAALFVIPLPALFLLVYLPPFSKKASLQWVSVFGGFFLMLLPLLTQPTYWIAKIPGTLFNRPELVGTATNASTHINTNLIYTLISPFFIVDESHFVSIGYTDPVTASLFLLGLTLLTWRFWRGRTYTFFFASFIYMLFALGVFHDRTFPPTTRMFLLLPWVMTLAALALFWVGSFLKRLGFSERISHAVLAGMAVAILGINFVQANPITKERFTRYQNFPTLFLRISQQAFQSAQSKDISITLIYNEENIHVPALVEILDLYQVPYEPVAIRQVTALPITDANTPRSQTQPRW
jgi:4-amino-4-deoxy-L-arabinose transferase-like glycosyltransferase